MAKAEQYSKIQDQSEMRITGALDYQKYSEMSNKELLAFICKDAHEKAWKFISPEWMDAVHIISIYTVIDSAYTHRAIVTAKLVYAHSIGVSGDITSIKKL